MIRPTQEQIERYDRDGIYVAKGLLNAEQLAKARACYDWGCANPGPEATIVFAAQSMNTSTSCGFLGHGRQVLGHSLTMSD